MKASRRLTLMALTRAETELAKYLKGNFPKAHPGNWLYQDEASAVEHQRQIVETLRAKLEAV